MRETAHPMEAKIALGKVVRQGQVPENIATVPLPDGITKDGAIQVDKLLAKVGLADSVTVAVRKIKTGAVEINGEKAKDLAVPPAPEMVIQVGKNWRRVTAG